MHRNEVGRCIETPSLPPSYAPSFTPMLILMKSAGDQFGSAKTKVIKH